LLAGWVVYALCRRSRTAGTLTFSVLMLSFSAGVVGQWAAERAKANGQQTATSGLPSRQAFPLVGVEVGPPPGWQALPPDREGIVARWVKAVPNARDATAIVMVELLRPQGGKDLLTQADALARKWGGRVVNPRDSLAGETAARFTGTPSGGGLQPVHGMTALHQDHLYLISGGATPGHSCDDAFEHVVRSWKWIPVEPPTKHLTFHPAPRAVCGGRLSVNYPAAMSTFEAGKPDGTFGVSLYNFKEHRPDFTAIIMLADTPEDVFADRQARITKGLQEKYNLPERLAWRPTKSAYANAAITDPVPGPSQDENGQNWIMWALVEPDPLHIVSVNFTLYARDPADRAAYAAVAARIVESITFDASAAGSASK
jgi:hypothetical protein